MLLDTNVPEPTMIEENFLTQAEFKALVRSLEGFMKFSPTLIAMQGGCLMAGADDGRASIHADYSPLLPVHAPLAFAPDREAIARLRLIQGEGDVCFRLTPEGHVLFEGDRMGVHVQAKPVPSPGFFALPIVIWLGNDFLIPAPKDVKAFIGRKHEDVQLAVFDDQIERIGIVGRGIYTFTAGMSEQFSRRSPDVVLSSRVGFRFIGDKSSIQLGMVGQEYILKVTNPMDMGVDLIVMEQLEVLHKA